MRQKVTHDGTLTQVHVSEDTVVEVVTNADTFTINIFRDGKGWDVIGDYSLSLSKDAKP